MILVQMRRGKKDIDDKYFTMLDTKKPSSPLHLKHHNYFGHKDKHVEKMKSSKQGNKSKSLIKHESRLKELDLFNLETINLWEDLRAVFTHVESCYYEGGNHMVCMSASMVQNNILKYIF